MVGEFRHDNAGCFNANILVGYEDMTYIVPLLEELGMDGAAKVRDLWRQKDLGEHEGRLAFKVPRHGCVLVKVEGP